MTNKTYAAFRQLHQSGCFVIPNPWDTGTARYLKHLGFKALATTSAGFAFSKGLPDSAGAVSIETALAHFAEIVSATDLPVNADFLNAFADDPETVAANVRRCVETGVAGLSVEDSTGNPAHPLYDINLATDRIRAARAAIDAAGSNVLLTARAECFLVGHATPLEESIRRLQAYAEAGADVLYAPGVTNKQDIQLVVKSVVPKPVNVLMGLANATLSVNELAGLGVRRISLGSALARAAWGGFMRAARGIVEQGSFAGFDGAVPFKEINALFAD